MRGLRMIFASVLALAMIAGRKGENERFLVRR